MERQLVSDATVQDLPVDEAPASMQEPPASRPADDATNVMSALSAAPAAASGDDEHITAGTIIASRYRIETWLGRGGMGAVYRAHDLHHDRPVALKLLHRAHGREAQPLKRFRREARLLRRLRSPHIVAIYDHGQTDTGMLYLAMEYLEGETLETRLKRCNVLNVAEALDIAITVLDALTVVHRAGIIHRDVKPANIFLASLPDGRQIVKLLDFGIAKPDTPETTELTAAGIACGTPRYMSPEQMLGQAVDHRADLFGVGVVLYRALTGMMPFNSETPAQLVYALVKSPPPPLSRHRPTLGMHGDLNRMIQHALARSPTVRYQSAYEMAGDLRTLFAEQSTQPQSGPGRWRWPTRFTPPVVRAVVVVLLLLTLLPLVELIGATRAPLAGFAISGLLVSPILPPEWEGYGVVRTYDEILAIDGHRLDNGRQGRAYLASLPQGTPVTYLLRRDGREFTAVMYVMHPSWRSIRQNYGLLYVTGFLLILIGALVAWSRPHLAEARALFVMTTMLGLVFLLARTRDFGGVLELAWPIAFSGVGVGCIHLALVYPARAAVLKRHPWGLSWLYAFGILIAGAVGLTDTLPAFARQGLRGGSAWDAACMLFLVGRLAYLRTRGATVAVRQSARQLLWAAGLSQGFAAFVGVAVAVTGRISNEGYQAVGLVFIWFPLVIAYQIRRGQLFDLDRVFARLQHGLLRYVLLVGIFVGAASLGLLIAHLLQADPMVELIVASLCGLAVMSLAYEPLARRLFPAQSQDDSSRSILIVQFSNMLHGMRSTLEVTELLIDTLQQHFRPQGLRVLEREGSGYLVRSLGQSEPTRTALVADVMPAATSSESHVHMQQPLAAADVVRHVSQFGRLRAYVELVLPLAAGDQTADSAGGPERLIVMGPRSDGNPYTGDEASLVEMLIHLAAARIELLDDMSVQS